MTTEQKVELVANTREEYGLTPTLAVLELPKSTWYYHRNEKLALTAWERARQTLLDLQIPSEGMIVHHDQDSVYTSYAWTGQLLRKDKVRISYALGGAKDNPEMEAFFSRFKSEGHSLFLDAATSDELVSIVDRRMQYYNEERLHSRLGYQPPREFIQQAVPTFVSEVHI
jgi:putative transposase